MTLRIARAVRTCTACPSQWSAWTDTGEYLYLRYRSGIGTVEAQLAEDVSTWDLDKPPLIEFGEPSLDGDISLDTFLALAHISLTPDAQVIDKSPVERLTAQGYGTMDYWERGPGRSGGAAQTE